MNARYPNLELLEYKVRMVLASDEEFLRTFEEKKKSNKYVYVEIDCWRCEDGLHDAQRGE